MSKSLQWLYFESIKSRFAIQWYCQMGFQNRVDRIIKLTFKSIMAITIAFQYENQFIRCLSQWLSVRISFSYFNSWWLANRIINSSSDCESIHYHDWSVEWLFHWLITNNATMEDKYNSIIHWLFHHSLQIESYRMIEWIIETKHQHPIINAQVLVYHRPNTQKC